MTARTARVLLGVILGFAVMAGLLIFDVIPDPWTAGHTPDIHWGIRTYPQETP